MNKFIKGIRFKLTLVYSTLFGVFIFVFAYIQSNQFIKLAQQDYDALLYNSAFEISHQFLISKDTHKHHIIFNDLSEQFKFAGETFYFIRDQNKKIITQTNPDFKVELPLENDFTHRTDSTFEIMNFEYKNKNYRCINFKFKNSLGNFFVLQLATDPRLFEDQKWTIIYINIVTIPLLIIISSFASFVIAGNALHPIKDLTEAANRIAINDLSLRVPVIETGDEIEELSKTFNTLLARLQKSFEAQEHFVANASHQLNTPLAIIKGELDLLESRVRGPEEQSKFLKSLREEVERLIFLVKDMLLISRVEAGYENFSFNRLHINDILIETIERLNLKARNKNISVRFNIKENLADLEDFSILGEKQLIESMVENIMENAIKYSPNNSIIRIDLESSNKNIVLSIADSGPGIAEEELNKLTLTRFQRSSKTMSPGTGIGLSIAYKIAEHHRATIKYKKLHPHGSLFQINLPRA